MLEEETYNEEIDPMQLHGECENNVRIVCVKKETRVEATSESSRLERLVLECKREVDQRT